MRVIIAGSRNIIDYALVVKAIHNVLARNTINPTEIVCGMAKGVDILGKQWAIQRGLPIIEYPALWNVVDLSTGLPIKIAYNKYGKPYNTLAGINRNIKMAKSADALIAIWDGSSVGTSHMIKIAKKHNLIVETFIIEGMN